MEKGNKRRCETSSFHIRNQQGTCARIVMIPHYKRVCWKYGTTKSLDLFNTKMKLQRACEILKFIDFLY